MPAQVQDAKAPVEVPGTAGHTQLQALIATAINTRRIALVLILAVFISTVTTLVSLWMSIYDPSAGTAKVVTMIWLAISSLTMFFGLIYILFSGRLSHL